MAKSFEIGRKAWSETTIIKNGEAVFVPNAKKIVAQGKEVYRRYDELARISNSYDDALSGYPRAVVRDPETGEIVYSMAGVNYTASATARLVVGTLTGSVRGEHLFGTSGGTSGAAVLLHKAGGIVFVEVIAPNNASIRGLYRHAYTAGQHTYTRINEVTNVGGAGWTNHRMAQTDNGYIIGQFGHQYSYGSILRLNPDGSYAATDTLPTTTPWAAVNTIAGIEVDGNDIIVGHFSGLDILNTWQIRRYRQTGIEGAFWELVSEHQYTTGLQHYSIPCKTPYGYVVTGGSASTSPYAFVLHPDLSLKATLSQASLGLMNYSAQVESATVNNGKVSYDGGLTWSPLGIPTLVPYILHAYNNPTKHFGSAFKWQ